MILKPFNPATLCDQINTIVCQNHRHVENSYRALEEKAALALAVIESSDDAIIAKDLDGTVRSWNRGAERLTQFSSDEIIGHNMRAIIPAELLEHESDMLEQISRGNTIGHFETKRLRKDGTLLDVSLTVSPIRDRNGNGTGASSVARDISERKTMEAALRESEQQLALAIQGMSVGVWDWNIAAGSLYWSDRFKEMLGLPPDFP